MYFSDDIKNYYGATIGIYFAFLEYYTFALIVPVLLSLTFLFITTDETWKNLIFAFVNVLWGTVFLELWKQNCVTISHRWGTLKANLGVWSVNVLQYIVVPKCTYSITVVYKAIKKITVKYETLSDCPNQELNPKRDHSIAEYMY